MLRTWICILRYLWAMEIPVCTHVHKDRMFKIVNIVNWRLAQWRPHEWEQIRTEKIIFKLLILYVCSHVEVVSIATPVLCFHGTLWRYLKVGHDKTTTTVPPPDIQTEPWRAEQFFLLQCPHSLRVRQTQQCPAEEVTTYRETSTQLSKLYILTQAHARIEKPCTQTQGYWVNICCLKIILF